MYLVIQWGDVLRVLPSFQESEKQSRRWDRRGSDYLGSGKGNLQGSGAIDLREVFKIRALVFEAVESTYRVTEEVMLGNVAPMSHLYGTVL